MGGIADQSAVSNRVLDAIGWIANSLGYAMTSYILIVTLATSFGAVNTYKAGGPYPSYQACAEDAFGQIESLRPIYPDLFIKWECQLEGER